MNRRLKRNVALGAVGAMALAGGGAAYAATSTTDPQDSLLKDAAQRLDVEPGELRAALKGAFGAQLDQAVKDGKLTQKQADEMKRHAPPFGGPPPGGGVLRFRGGPPPGGPDRMIMRGPIGPGFDAAAEYLGLTQAQLRARLVKGNSLADVAKAEGRSVEGLQQAMLAKAKTELEKGVADGDLTQEQADEMLEHLTADIDQIVQGKGPGPDKACGPGGPGGPHFERRGSSGGSDERGFSATPGSFDSSSKTTTAGSI